MSLIAGQLPRQILSQPRRQVTFEAECNAAPMAFGDHARANQHQLQIQKLVEGQAPAPPLRLLQRTRTVHRLKRLRKRRQPQTRRQGRWQNIFCQGYKGVEVPIDQRADDLVTQSLGRRIDRQHFTAE
jgi:hypothetical protein